MGKFIKRQLITLHFLTTFFCIAASAMSGAAQSNLEPRREQLLNGLDVVLLPNPADAKVLVKVRIRAGAAFDLAGKAGTMALLGDALFPDPQTREFFADELGGRLEVVTDYDSINISMTGHAAAFERMIDFLRTALVNTQLNAETVAKVRGARLKVVKETSSAPAAVADRALAARVFGNFPYGKPMQGSTESLAKIERADVMFARERFLNANNATILVAGGIDEHRAMRALRQLLGGWGRSEQIVPPTFRQNTQEERPTLIVDLPGSETAEVRLGVRGLARSDQEYAAASLLTLLARDRWQASLPALNRVPLFVRHEAHVLPGLFVMGASVPVSITVDAIRAARNAIKSLVTTPASASELERIRKEAIADLGKRLAQPDSLADVLLDQDTYRLGPIDVQMRSLGSVAAVEVQGAAAKLFRDVPLSTVIVASASQLQPPIQPLGPVEIVSEKQLDEAPLNSLPVKSVPTVLKPKQP